MASSLIAQSMWQETTSYFLDSSDGFGIEATIREDDLATNFINDLLSWFAPTMIQVTDPQQIAALKANMSGLLNNTCDIYARSETWEFLRWGITYDTTKGFDSASAPVTKLRNEINENYYNFDWHKPLSKCPLTDKAPLFGKGQVITLVVAFSAFALILLSCYLYHRTACCKSRNKTVSQDDSYKQVGEAQTEKSTASMEP